jgi:Tol biopolymer transport system component
MAHTPTNPYITDRAVGKGLPFYGREAEFDWVTQSCVRGERILILHGPHRIGKTSFLAQLPHKLSGDYIVIYVDLGPLAESPADQLVWQVAKDLRRGLANSGWAALPEPRLDDFRRHTADPLADMLAEAEQQLGARRLIVALDSVDALRLTDGGEDKLWRLVASLADRLDQRERVHLLFAGHKIEDLQGTRTPRFEHASVRRLGALSMNAATSLVIEPVRDFISFEPPAVRRIVELSSGHPYYLQLICQAIYDDSGETTWTVSVGDIERIVGHLLSGPMDEFEAIWETSTLSERIVLTGLGTIRGSHGIATRQEVGNALRRQRINITQEEVTDNLECLVARDVLERLGALTYRFRVDMMRTWLCRSKTIEEIAAQLGHGRRSEEVAASTLRHMFIGGLGIAVLVVVALVVGWPRGGQEPAAVADAQATGSPMATQNATAAPIAGPTLTSTPHPTPTRPRVRMRSVPTIAYFAREGLKDVWQIWVMGSDGKDPVRVTTTETNETGAAWSPDGNRFAFVSERDGNREIYVMDGEGNNATRLTKHPADDWMPVWSPDGKEIAFVSRRNGPWEIYTIKPDGSDLKRLTGVNGPEGNNWTPAYSPDGQEIVFASNRDNDWELYVMNRDGSSPLRLTNVPGNDFSPAWSPKGDKIVFESTRDGNAEIYVMNKDGSDQVNLSRTSSADDHWPCWSPDGSHIAFMSNRDGDWDIFSMNIDGSDVVNLTRNRPGSKQGPSWRP